MNKNENSQRLAAFISKCPTAYHLTEETRRRLAAAGYELLLESAPWHLRAGGKYCVIRNGSTIAAFRIPKEKPEGFMIMASHSDSPLLKLKENPEIRGNGYTKLNVEVYGGALLAPWFDRPLSVAGRLIVREEGRIATRLVDMERSLLTIPSLAIHMNRQANEGGKLNPQKDLLPVLGSGDCASLLALLTEKCNQDRAAAVGSSRAGGIGAAPGEGTAAAVGSSRAGGIGASPGEGTAAAVGCSSAEGVPRAARPALRPEDVLGQDLYVYCREQPYFWGAENEYLSAPRLDDLTCAFASLEGFLRAESSGEGTAVPVHIVFDNEEVGSSTRQGAASTFLRDVLVRISAGLGCSESEHLQLLAKSFMLSADNAHALHPNYPEKCDPVNKPVMGKGVVIKYSANQKYTTDALSAAVVRVLAERACISLQVFTNRADVPGGSTLGNISGRQVAVPAADIGIAQLAMHSPCECIGCADVDDMIALAETFYSSSLEETGYGSYALGEMV